MQTQRNRAISLDVWHHKEAEKRTISINVRVTTEERDALAWMARQLAPIHGTLDNPALIRRSLELLYGQLRAQEQKPQAPALTADGVRKKLQASNVTQAEAARKAGLHPSVVSRFVNGRQPLADDALARLDAALE